MVLCIDTLEHVPREVRGDVVREICRVCVRQVILGFPWGEGISVWDRRLADHLRRRGTEIPVWLSEHLAHDPPDPIRVSADLEACGFMVAHVGAAPAFGHFLLMCAEARPYLGRKLNSLSRRISRTLTGRPRHRFDPALVRLLRRNDSVTTARRHSDVLLMYAGPRGSRRALHVARQGHVGGWSRDVVRQR
jgi:hypothetical protein